MKKKARKRYVYLFIGFILLIYFFHFQNNSLVISEYTVSSGHIPKSFDGYTIVQLSDLHSKSFGNNQGKLVEKVGKINPDLIVFTGDLVDSKRYDEKSSLLLMEKLIQLAPVYFVTGNHEWWSGKFNSLEVKLKDLGVQVLRNTIEEINNGYDKIQLTGIDDPANVKDRYPEPWIIDEVIENVLQEVEEGASFKILLSHRPELFSLYAQFDFDLVFSGHAHGGQFRFPLIGGLIAPNQGWFPEYYAGEYILDKTTMIVNRGLGNSIIPLRLFNRPEIVIVTLQAS